MARSSKPWIEIGSVLALVGGLVLVSAQIKQSTDITRIQLDTSVRQNWRTVDSTRQSEEFAKVLATSIERPQDLTLAEFIELDAYYLGVTDQLSAFASHYRAGYRGDLSLKNTIEINVEIYFGNAFAKAWANRHYAKMENYNEEWVHIFLAAVQQADSGGMEAKYRGVLQDLD